MKEDDRKQWIVALIGWLVVIGLFLGLCVHSVSAIELNLDKNQSCTLFNYTGTQCDSFWCVSGLKGNWTTDGICWMNVTINNSVNTTNITNQTYMNETLMREIALNITNELLANNSFINASTMIAIKNAILDAQENRTEELVKSYMSDYETPKEPIPTGIIIAIIVVFGGVLFFGIYTSSKKKEKSPWEEFEDKPRYDPRKPYKGPPSPKEVKDFEKTGEVPETKEEDEE